jgi:peptidoglycan L-alanyl-D-glutamate endopeptidase CwlK
MPFFGRISTAQLASAHEDLQKIFNEVIKTTDCMVICGHRGEEAQNACFAAKTSKLKWPDSKHNKTPSLAVDVVPFPLNWADTERFRVFAEKVKEVARGLGVGVVWGGDWKGFRDVPHWQLG